MSSRDLQAVVKTQKAFIRELLDRLEGKKDDEVSLYTQTVFSIKDKSYSVIDLIDLLNDTYFNGLTLEQIFELAKKSIRLTDDNCKMRHKLEDIEEIVNAIYGYQVECKDKTNKDFLDKQLQKISDKLLDK
mgnify:CR=1 FL=1